jgi:hypothetical protein
MAAAANYAWANRAAMTHLARQAFAKVFDTTPDDLDMAVVYDVSHNIAKVRIIVVVCFCWFCLEELGRVMIVCVFCMLSSKHKHPLQT